jgi:tetratricopeptide (TPR) repeat protein
MLPVIDRLVRNWRILLSATLLALATLAVFHPVLNAEFIKLDDGYYVVHNPHVTTGLTWANVNWAFRSRYQANWHPLTWLSHMLDAQLFGLNPGRHHLTNVILHTADAVLLLLLLHGLTRAPWRSLMVAGLFALHPLHVESVAWVSERKDVLSTLFLLGTLLSYARYARMRGASSVGKDVSRITHRSSFFYVLSLVLFALGLMCKPMLVSLPALLLLLDFWPLRRFGPESGIRPGALILEKVPFLALAFASCAITLVAAAVGGTGALDLPLTARVGNALASYLKYLGKMIWPTELAIFYPHPATRYPFSTQWPAWELLAGALVLAGVSVLAVRWRKRAPWFITGWFWYVIALLPVIGLVQVGGQAMADRYTYVPLIGVFICLVWAFAEAGAKVLPASSSFSPLLAGVGLVALAACALVTRRQLEFWRNNAPLFEHALAVTCDNAVAFYNIGRACEEEGNPKVAMPFFRAALAADPRYFAASSDLGLLLEERGHINQALSLYLEAVRRAPWAADIQNHLGTMLWKMGREDEAIAHYIAAVQASPDFADAHYNLGTCLATRGQWPDAVSEFEAVVRLRPNDADAQGCLGQALLNEGQPAAAENRFRQVALLSPTNAEAHLRLGMLAARRNDLDASLAEFRLAVQLRPDWPEALNGLAFLLATNPKPEQRNGAEAVRLAERACAMAGTNQPRFWSTLDTAYAEAGRFSDAIRAAEKARDLALAAEQKGMADAASARIELYRKGKAFRQ